MNKNKRRNKECKDSLEDLEEERRRKRRKNKEEERKKKKTRGEETNHDMHAERTDLGVMCLVFMAHRLHLPIIDCKLIPTETGCGMEVGWE